MRRASAEPQHGNKLVKKMLQARNIMLVMFAIYFDNARAGYTF